MITPNALLLKEQLEARFPGINSPRPIEVYNPRLCVTCVVQRWSEHAWGNALDIFGTAAFLKMVHAWLLTRRRAWNGVGFGELLYGDAAHLNHVHVAPNPLYHRRAGVYRVPEEARQRPNRIPPLPVFPGDDSRAEVPVAGSAALGVEIEIQMWMTVYAENPTGGEPTRVTRDVSEWVRPADGYAGRQMDSQIPGEMVVTFSREFHWPTVELKPVLLMKDLHTGLYEVKHPLGVYYVHRDRRIGEETDDDESLPTFRLWCKDGLKLLNKPVGRTVTVAADDVVTDVVTELIVEALETGPFRPKVVINPSSKTSGVDRVWEMQSKTTFLQIVQTMLTDLGYGALYVNPDGTFVSGIFLPPLHRKIAGHYSSERAPGRWTRIGYPVNTTREWGLPNKWVFFSNDVGPEAPAPDPSDPDTWYEVLNRYTGDESITGSLSTTVEPVGFNVSGAEDLKAAGDRYAELEIQKSNQTIMLRVLPSPFFWHNNLLYLSIREVGIAPATPAALTFWRCPFDGQNMSMQATLLNPRVVVRGPDLS